MRIFGNKRSPSLSVLCILVCIHAEISKCQVVAESQCERLKASLTYTQEEAPRDLSGVVRCLFRIPMTVIDMSLLTLD